MIEIDFQAQIGPMKSSNSKQGRNKKGLQQCVMMRDYDGSSSFIRTISGFFTTEERTSFISAAEDMGFERTEQRETRECAHRAQWRISFDDTEIASLLYRRVLPFLPGDIDNARPHSCSSNIRVYKYDEGDSFGAHFDDTNSVEIPAEDGVAFARGSGKKKGKKKAAAAQVGWTKLTILIYLNGHDHPVEGGETKFYAGEKGGEVFVSFSPAESAGDLLMHGHGHRCLLHEAAPVTSGTKYMLRTDVVYL